MKGAKRLAKDRRSLSSSALRTKDPCTTLQSCEKARSTLTRTEDPYTAALINLASTLRKRVPNTCAAGTLTASENPGECATGRTVVRTELFSGRAGGRRLKLPQRLSQNGNSHQLQHGGNSKPPPTYPTQVRELVTSTAHCDQQQACEH